MLAKRSWTVVGSLGVVVLAALLHAQQGTTFRTGVQVALLDVSVVDRSGRPVAGLSAADFVVTVDRQPRTIVSAQFLQYDTRPRTPEGPASAAPASPAGPGRLAPPLVPRSMLIVIDEDNIETVDGLLARQTAARLIDRLMPDDRVGVTTVPRLTGRLLMTSDHASAKNALEAVITGMSREADEFNIGLAEAMGGDRDRVQRVISRECHGGFAPGASRGLDDPNCSMRVGLQIERMKTQTRLRGQRTTEAMSAIADYLRQVAGPKVLVFITGGMPMPGESSSPFARLDRQFAESQVSLYTLQLQRLSIADARGRPSPTPGEDDALLDDGIENLTARTGGTLLKAIGTMDQYVDRIVTELSGSYLLGMEVPPTDSDDRLHQVAVRVNRPGVEVRARRQYVIGRTSGIGNKPDARSVTIETGASADGGILASPEVEKIMAAGRTLEGTGEIAIDAKAAMAKGGGAREVVVKATIDARTLLLPRLDDRRVGRIAITVFCGDSRRAVVGEGWQEMNLSLTDATYEKFKKEGIPCTVRVPVTRNARYVKVVVYDRRADRVGALVTKVKDR